MSQTLTAYQYGIRARNALWAIFFFMGVVSMAWVPRIPEIKEAVGLTNSQLGLVFIVRNCVSWLGSVGSKKFDIVQCCNSPVGVANHVLKNR